MSENTETQTTLIFGNSGAANVTELAFQEATLQTLNRRVGADELVLVKEMFEASVSDWEGIPLIFHEGGQHPMDFAAVTEDPAAAAEAIGGKLVGSVTNPKILTTGHPRLVADLVTDDPDIKRLYDIGQLGISTAFEVRHNRDRITSPPIPNHVLLFREVVDGAQQGDPGALVHTTEAKMEEKPQKKSFSESFSEWIKRVVREEIAQSNTTEEEASPKSPEGHSMTDEDTAKNPETPDTLKPGNDLGNEKIAELLKQIADRDEKIAALEEQLKQKIDEEMQTVNALKSRVEEFEAKEKKQKIDALMNSLPEGMRTNEDQCKALREEFEADPVSAALKIMNTIKAAPTSGETNPVGQRFGFSVTQDGYPVLGNLNPNLKKED